MKIPFKSKNLAWLILALILLVAALVVIVAPEEATLGRGIKIVYVHVALIWTGILGLLINGVLGLIQLIIPSRRRHDWLRSLGWISLGMFGAGMFTSIIASQINWGNVAWQEPRMAANLNLLAFIVIIQVSGAFLENKRLLGALHLFIAGLVIYTDAVTPRELHPDDPISTATSNQIQLTFYGLFALSTLLAVWLVWYWLQFQARSLTQKE